MLSSHLAAESSSVRNTLSQSASGRLVAAETQESDSGHLNPSSVT